MLKIDARKLVGSVLLFFATDMISTYLLANHAYKMGMTLTEISKAELNPWITELWLLTNNISVSLIIYSAFIAIFVFCSLWEMPQQDVYADDDHSVFLGFGVGICVLSSWGLTNNFGILFFGTGVSSPCLIRPLLPAILIFLPAFFGWILSQKTEKKIVKICR